MHFRMRHGLEQATTNLLPLLEPARSPCLESARIHKSIRPASVRRSRRSPAALAMADAMNGNCADKARTAARKLPCASPLLKSFPESALPAAAAAPRCHRSRNARTRDASEAPPWRKIAYCKSHTATAGPRTHSRHVRSQTSASIAGTLRLDTLGSSSKTSGGDWRGAYEIPLDSAIAGYNKLYNLE